jgi:hypothetical protein
MDKVPLFFVVAHLPHGTYKLFLLKVNLTSLNSKTEVGCAAAETNTDDLIESIMIMNPDGVQFSIFAGYAEKSVGECTEYPAPYSYVENKNKITSTTATTAGLYNIDCPKVAYQKCCFIVKCLSANCGSKMTIWSRIYDEAVIREPITGLSDGAKAGLAIFGIFCVLMAISIFLHTTNIFRFYCFDCCAEACCHEKKPKRRGGGASSSYSVPSYPVMINPSSSSYTPQSSSGYPKTTLSSAGYGAKSASGRDLTADRSKVAGASTLTGKMGSAVGKSASNLTSPASPSPSPAPASASKSSKSLTAKSPRYDDNFDDRPRRR